MKVESWQGINGKLVHDDQRLAIRNSDLPAKLRRRVRRPGTKHHRINKKNLGHSIEERPTVVQARQELGHWEGDL